MKMRTFAAAAAAVSVLLVACGDDSDDAANTTVAETVAPADTSDSMTTEPMTTEPMTTEPMTTDEMGDMGTIVDVASGNEDFSTLVAAVGAAGLAETLSGEGPFTVFAPTNEAFAALPAGLVDKLLLPENKEILTQILTYHVVAGKVMAADVAAGEVETVEGSPITIAVDNGAVTLNGSANVVATDVLASNGVIHVIDAVILPPGLDVSAL